MKFIFILRHECRDWTLRTLNSLAIKAYGLEIGANVFDFSSLEYVPGIRQSISLFARIMKPMGWVWTHASEPFLLPPSGSPPKKFRALFEAQQILYLCGWPFENPEGILKHRDTLIRQLGIHSPKTISKKHIIGIYHKSHCYPYFSDGSFLVPKERMSAIVDEYLREQELTHNAVELVEVSDKEDVDTMRKLVHVDVLIGPNRPFCVLAAWAADAPYVVATNAPMQWDYYRNKTRYFVNAYATGIVGLSEND